MLYGEFFQVETVMIEIERNAYNNEFGMNGRVRCAEPPQASSSLWKTFDGGASSLNLHVSFRNANSLPQTS